MHQTLNLFLPLLNSEFLIDFYQTGPCNIGAKKVKADDEEGQSAKHEEEQHGEAEKDAHRLLDGEEHLGGQVIIIIITTRPKQAYGRQGLAGLWGQDTDQAGTFWGVVNISLRAFSAQLG